jgi:hypothetical protein
MKRYCIFFCTILCILSYNNTTAQQSNPFATAANREAITTELRKFSDSVVKYISFHDNHLMLWNKAGWAMELMLYKHPHFLKRIPELITAFPTLRAEMQWCLLQTWYTLFPGKEVNALQTVWASARSHKIKALILVHLQAANLTMQIPSDDPFLESPYARLFDSWKQQQLPLYTIDTLSRINILKGKSLLVSVQYRNRDQPGFLMIRKSNGQWIKNKNGSIQRYLQLARAITNLPYFLTNGNTPQGLYRITGTAVSDNDWIGPTENLQMVMPFEKGGALNFFDSDADLHQQYAQLLGDLGKDSSLWQSFHAGFVGRSEIIAHGTTIPTEYYRAYRYYPNTPSLGCLCSPEKWNEQGILSTSVQQEWMKAIRSLPQMPEYLLVVEVKAK